MSKKGLIVFIIALIVLLSLSPRSIRPVFGQAVSMEAPHFGEGGLPQFERDPNFPKVPSKWRMGFGSDVAVDAQDHIWIDRKSTRLNSSHLVISYAVFCLKKKKKNMTS